MLKETDMNGVRKTARLFLMLEPVPTKLSPMVIKHPFTDSGFVMTRGDGDNPVKMVNIMEDQKALHQWREEKAEQIRALKEPNELFTMLTKSYYMGFLKYAMPYLSHKDFSEYLGTAWICDENPNSDPNFTTQKLVGLFKKADPTLDGMFVVKNLRVVNGSKGCFVAMPQERYTDSKGNLQYRDTFFPMNDKARSAMEAAVLAAYDVEMYENPPAWAVGSAGMDAMLL